MLLEYVYYKECGGQTVEVGDAAEVFLELGALTCNLQFLTLGEVVKSAILAHLVDGSHLLDGFADGGEVGEHAAGPAFDDVGHAYCGGFVGHYLFGLFFCGYEQHFLAGFGYALECCSSFFDLGCGLYKVDDVDTVTLHEYIGSHSRIPFSFEVTEVASCFEELFKCWGCHDLMVGVCLRSFW